MTQRKSSIYLTRTDNNPYDTRLFRSEIRVQTTKNDTLHISQ